MVTKINTMTVKTIKGPAIQTAGALASMSPEYLQTNKMVATDLITKLIPLVSATEWEKYLTLPPQCPPPSTTVGKVQGWKTRFAQFPRLAPVAIAYLVTPRSAAQAERSFSLLGNNKTTTRWQASFVGGSVRLRIPSYFLAPQFFCSQGVFPYKIQTVNRLHMSDPTLQALTFLCVNQDLFTLSLQPSKGAIN